MNKGRCSGTFISKPDFEVELLVEYTSVFC